MELIELVEKLSKLDSRLPHCSNLKKKATDELKKPSKNIALTKEIVSLYLKYNSEIQKLNKTSDSKKWITTALNHFEKYYSEIKTAKFKIFSHQSDFLSSLLPEFLYLLYKKFVIPKFKGFVIETQKDLVIDFH